VFALSSCCQVDDHAGVAAVRFRLPSRLLSQKVLVRTNCSIATLIRTNLDQVMPQQEQVDATCSSNLRVLIHARDWLYG